MSRKIIVLLVMIAALTAGWLIIAGGRSLLSSTENENENQVFSLPFSYYGSVGYWWAEEGLRVLQANIDALDGVTLYVYGLGEGGSIVLGEPVPLSVEEEILALAHTRDKEVILGINNFEQPELVDPLFDDATQVDHFHQLLGLVEEKGYDGVAIDYENLRGDQTTAFSAYMARLGAELHARDKKLIITLVTGNRGRVWDGINISQVAPHVDRIELQTFGEHSSYTDAGPTASLEWVEAIIRNAVKLEIPREKIIFGVAFSGHDWLRTDDGDTLQQSGSTREIQTWDRTKMAHLIWDDEHQSHFYEYTGDGGDHLVWIEDSRSAQAKIDYLRRKYGIGGVFFWYLGGEDPAIWNSISGGN